VDLNTSHFLAKLFKDFLVLISRLSLPVDVYHKMERESYRAFHNRNYTHTSDHFCNFCITAHSMRDILLQFIEGNAKGNKVNRDEYHTRWNKNPTVAAIADFGNSAKHFTLRHPLKQACSLDDTMSDVVEIWLDDDKRMTLVPVEIASLTIDLKDKCYNLYDFCEKVLEFWKAELQQSGINIPKQKESIFFGADSSKK
jgi:hypothetical protein